MGELESLYLSKKKTISTFNLSNLLKLTIFSTFGEYSVNVCSAIPYIAFNPLSASVSLI